MSKQSTRTELSELGEFGLIKHLTQNVKLNNKSSKLGIGDDAAVIDSGAKQIILTTDMLVEGVHFDLMYVPLKHLGYKAATVNFSDIYAMNSYPKQITVSLAVSSRFSLEALEEIYEGIALACSTYGVDMVGGDTTSSTSGLVLSITAIGEADKNKVVTRKGAKENDLLCVSGDLGGAYLGLQVLEREKSVFQQDDKIQPDLSGHDYILERQLKPEPRKDVIDLLAEKKVIPTAMIDVSDGLASEVMHIADQSGVGIAVYEEKIPIDFTTTNIAEQFKLDPTICALNGGEDYELLFTINQKDFDKIKESSQITVIGHVTDKASGNQLVTRSGSQIPLTAQGWDAFTETGKQ